MGLKSIWQQLVSLKDRLLKRAQWSSKNKAIIGRFQEVARRSMERAAPDLDPKDKADPVSPSLPQPLAKSLPDGVKKQPNTAVPPSLAAILNSAQREAIEEALSQQARVRDLYGAEALRSTARRFFKDPRISSVLATGVEQLNHDIRFVSDEKIHEIGTPLHEVGGMYKGVYDVLSAAFINAADPQEEPMRITRLQGNLRVHGVILGEPVVQGFEAALKEYGDSLKEPSSKVVPLRKPRDPDGMK